MKIKVEKTANYYKGVTLVALVVTIIILLILAGVLLYAVFNDNGLLQKIRQAVIYNYISEVEEAGRTIYSEELVKNLSNGLEGNVDISDVIDKLKSKGYLIEGRTEETVNVTAINLEKKDMSFNINETKELKMTFDYEGGDLFTYYLEREDKYYKIHNNNGYITIDIEPSNLTREDFELAINNVFSKIASNSNIMPRNSSFSLDIISSNPAVAIANLKSGSNSIAEITSFEQEGEADITFSIGECSETCKIVVVNTTPVDSIEVEGTEDKVEIGKTITLSAKVNPSNTKFQKVTWVSEDTNIAVVDENGCVKGLKNGTTNIMAVSTDGNNVISNKYKITILGDYLLSDLANDGNILLKDTTARDIYKNNVVVPAGYKVLKNNTSNSDIAKVEYKYDTQNHTPCVQDGVVISDNDNNQFVWIPVGKVENKDGTTTEITLGRYDFYTSTILKQDSKNYTGTVTINERGNALPYYQELIKDSGNVAAVSLENFINRVKSDSGYWFARYEASGNTTIGAKSKYNKSPWTNMNQSNASTYAKGMKSTGTYKSDLANGYSWDTAVKFIETYSGNPNFSRNFTTGSFSSTQANTGTSNDNVCNIFDTLTNCWEWSTEHSTFSLNSTGYPCTARGGNQTGYSAIRGSFTASDAYLGISFRVVIY